MSSQDSVCKKTRLKRDLPSCSFSAASSEMDLTLWGTLPGDIAISVVAKLSWDEICALSRKRVWKKLWEASLHQNLFDEYASGRLQKPIGVLHGCYDLRSPTELENGTKHNCKLRFAVLAGDGHKEPSNLSISKAQDVATLHHDALQLPVMPNSQEFCIDTLGAAGCFVLVCYRARRSSRRIGRDLWMVVNPANATARQIIYPSHNNIIPPGVYGNGHHPMSINGILKDGDSHYQILVRSYDVNEEGDHFYMHNLPKQDDLGGQEIDGDDDQSNSDSEDDERENGTHHIHATFFVYMSRTNSWNELLGCNLSVASNFKNPVLYNGVIHALVVSNRRFPHRANSPAKRCAVYRVGDTSGTTRWIPLAIPLPSKYLLFAHLFVFEGTLMLAAGLDQTDRLAGSGWLGSVCIWRLHEEQMTWVEVARMPDPMIDESGSTISCNHLWGMKVLSSNGDYVMLWGEYLPPESRPPRALPEYVVMYNIATGNWQIILSQKAPFPNQFVTLFERRLEVSA